MIVNVMSAKKIKAKRKDKDKSVQYYIDEANKVKALEIPIIPNGFAP